jgi:hypothetical protein
MNRISSWLVIVLAGINAGCANDSGPGIAPLPPGKGVADSTPAKTETPAPGGRPLQPVNMPGLSITPKAK